MRSSVFRAFTTLSVVFVFIGIIISWRESRSVSTSKRGRLFCMPCTVSISQCPKVSRELISSGRCSMLKPLGPGPHGRGDNPSFRRLMREVFIRYPEEKAEVDIAIESADGNLGIEYEALCLDLAEGGLRRSVPAFDGGLEVSGEAVILADLRPGPLSG